MVLTGRSRSSLYSSLPLFSCFLGIWVLIFVLCTDETRQKRLKQISCEVVEVPGGSGLLPPSLAAVGWVVTLESPAAPRRDSQRNKPQTLDPQDSF